MQKHPLMCLQHHQQHQASSSMSATTSLSRTWTLQHGWCAIVNSQARHLNTICAPTGLSMRIGCAVLLSQLECALLTSPQLLFQVRVEGEGMKRVELSLKDLTTNFKKHTVTSTLQCTGNRRDMFNDFKKVKGLEWGVGKWLRMSIVSSSTVHSCVAVRSVHAA